MDKPNKAYRLVEDLTVPVNNMVELLEQWIEEGLPETLTPEQWKAKCTAELSTVLCKKGEVFYQSRIFKNKEGEPYLYNSMVSADTLKPAERFFYTEYNQYTLWQEHLERMNIYYSRGKYEETTADEPTFEQLHFIPLLNKEILSLETHINDTQEKIGNCERLINDINGLTN